MCHDFRGILNKPASPAGPVENLVFMNLVSRHARLRTAAVLACLCAIGAPVRAQEDGQAAAAPPPAHLAVVDGEVHVEHDGVAQPAVANVPFLPGDRLLTSEGRVEIFFENGSVLDVDRASRLDLQSDTLVRVDAGRLLLTVPRGSPARFRVDTPAGSVQTGGPGQYRVIVVGDPPATTELDVVRGSATLVNDRGSVRVAAGERTAARDGDVPMAAQAFNGAHYDDFDLWTLSQRDARTAMTPTDYLPADLRVYGGSLDQNGSWEYTDPYGYVWYPAVVADWQPYSHGYWAPYRRYGWTWVGVEPWAWPTHHYGRWGYRQNRWFWIPGRTWGPAWVAWSSAPGYVGWCPLTDKGRPVCAATPTGAHAHWTVVPRSAFGVRRTDDVAVASVTAGATRALAAPRIAPTSTRTPVTPPKPIVMPSTAKPAVGVAVPPAPAMAPAQPILPAGSPHPAAQAPPRPTPAPAPPAATTAPANASTPAGAAPPKTGGLAVHPAPSGRGGTKGQ